MYRITTITVICKFTSRIDTQLVFNSISLSFDRVLETSFKGKTRSIYNKKEKDIDKLFMIKNNLYRYSNNEFTKLQIRSEPRGVFGNQVTLIIRSHTDNKVVNVKLFTNGSMQATGCMSLKGFCEILNKLNYDIQSFTNRLVVMTRPRYCLINACFKLGFKIDTRRLFNYLTSINVYSVYNFDRHACVNMKLSQGSVFVFTSGSVLITGVKKKSHIREMYKYVVKLILDNFGSIAHIETLSSLNDKHRPGPGPGPGPD